MAEEDRLIEAGLLPGIDFCRKALAITALGRIPSAKHLRRCQVCLRRWRVTEACANGRSFTTHAITWDIALCL